jgi:hypothetical protein
MTLQEFRAESRLYFERQSKIEHPQLHEVERAIASDLFMQWAMRLYAANISKFEQMPVSMLAGALNAVLPGAAVKAMVH